MSQGGDISLRPDEKRMSRNFPGSSRGARALLEEGNLRERQAARQGGTHWGDREEDAARPGGSGRCQQRLPQEGSARLQNPGETQGRQCHLLCQIGFPGPCVGRS